jgi:hypothetical protein
MALGSDIKGKIVTLMTGAFGFVAALQWNNAITEWLKPITAAGQGALPLTGVAILVTIIAIVAIYAIGRAMK